ncbi:Neurogenic locus protein delta,Protein eyes shut homolog,Neurogenic locus Notch protein,Neurogenic locus notch homolog protein 3,Protein eyes shut,Neurogenic locus notch homolog protein 1,Fibropellin-3,Protein crumbs homolog 2,Sushi, nidogen and EGF-like domain-containing protein 1,Protein jagged-1a,Sushi, von Willebrand factor type A, EGF and pentraxin domain-containing protein 1,Neurogenic locus notch homolog protein 2,Delta-like protein B,Protein crumbs homolog 1,Delta-like protein D,Protein jagged-1,Pr|uniref:EGF-like domain-containing protein n=1 Tax=Mytilus coruscus TaxID=42192 RepID=A0A6J8BXT5_MYTCO|nr:Neurogenic locus protein delta,Protein eyes shut homolog,Neurogenic locus Notch protein,Neurogenic locus notch homolog protein 3,Protein eyes shut,Neurogenic locus notch homolog protein 1,Fibropellin-3,Protein crumbs homolog 2,Sushi, nidogen and EGF-like domain-containing protein 1,Protein jagged-1a,Sushi, von Willebrand factor type A, EGF and pentraxin domain-containing protein 1,Neurogenic locus notch homolog protein 2,Delta-like protein B,Protein crumbs homolog 1,Delta-like protein D,Protein 
MGQRTMPVTLNSSTDNIYRFGYAGSNWVSLVKGGSSWSLMATANLTVRSDTGLINSPPIFSMQPVVRLKQSCSYSIKIPVIDEDGDFVKCRWATNSSGVNECGNACHGLSNSILDEENCTVSYDATGASGWYVVALQIEDFATRQYTNPFSSLPLQFMVYIYSLNASSCDSKPVIETTVADGSVIQIYMNTTYRQTIIESSLSSIAEINTVSPLGMTKSNLLTYGTSNNKWYINVTWTPTETHIGSHIFCYTAFDNNREASDQECIRLVVLNDCSSNPCVNGASCNDQINGYKCTCAAGFTDTHCETDIDECASNPCENGATCNDKVNGFNCTCADGFTDTQCQTDIDECASNPCENGATCNDQVNGYNCSCAAGFTNTHCETDIDDCANNPCQYGTCHDRVDDFHCDCVIFLKGKICHKRKCKRDDEKKKVKPLKINVKPKLMDLEWI